MNSETDAQKSACCEIKPDLDAHDIDPICGMAVNGTKTEFRTFFFGTNYYFCSSHCQKVFLNNFKKNIADIEAGKGIKPRNNRSLLLGIVGTVSLITFFLIVVLLANESVGFAISEIQRLWYWVLILAAGFGLQLGLFVHIRHTLHQKMTGASAEVAASGAVSTGSMVACCSHGLVNLLPIFGISAAATFLARYQLPFILFGVFSNLVGVTIMVGLAQKNRIIFNNPLISAVTTLNMKLVRMFLVLTGVIAIGFSIVAS